MKHRSPSFMKHRSTAALLVACLFASAACAADSAMPADTSRPSQFNVVWDSPSANSNGSMPLGNGDIGANAWVEPSGDLVLLLSKTDALDANARLLKLGQLRIKMEPALVKPGVPFRQELDLKTGTIVIKSGAAGDSATISLWIDANNPVVRIEVQSATPRKVSVTHETWRTARYESTGADYSSFCVGRNGKSWNGQRLWVEPDTVVAGKTNGLVFYHRNEHSIWAENLEGLNLSDWTKQAQDPLLHLTFGAAVQAEGMRHAGNQRLETVSPVKTLAINITAHTAITETPELWIAGITAKAAACAPLAAARAAHQKWWGDFWSRSWIEVRTPRGAKPAESANAAVVSQGYALQRWMTACAGRGTKPIRFNGSIFTVQDRDTGMMGEGKGPMHNHDYRRHGPNMWWQNTRHAYWPLLDTGDFDLMPSLFKTYTDMAPLRKLATRHYFQHDGMFFDEIAFPWGGTDAACYGTGAARKDKPLGWYKLPDIRGYWQGGLELTAMMLRYCDYTGDRKFRLETVLPFAHDIVTFYDRHYKRDAAGKILIAPANALEDIWNCKNPAPEIAGLQANLTTLLALTEDAAKKATYKRMLAELPELPRAKDAAGKDCLIACMPEGGRLPYQFPKATGKDSPGATRKYNTEKPELYCVFPYMLYGVGRPGLDAAKVAWSHSIQKYMGQIKPLCWNQDSTFLACLGMTDGAKREVIARAKNKYRLSRFPAFWAPNFDWVPDQDHGGVLQVALQKMLMQPDLSCHSDKIWLLPAWPKEWDVNFKLHAPFATTIECELRAGKVVKLIVTPASREKDVEVCAPFVLEK